MFSISAALFCGVVALLASLNDKDYLYDHCLSAADNWGGENLDCRTS